MENKVNYEEFCKQFKNRIVGSKRWNVEEQDYAFYPNGYTTDEGNLLEFIRDTNMRYYSVESDTLVGDFAIVIIERGGKSGSCCRFHLNALYEEYQKNGWKEVMSYVDKNIRVIEKNNFKQLAELISDYDAIKERLMFCVVNYTDHKYELKSIVYKLYGDVALVLHCIIRDDDDDGFSSFAVDKEVMALWNVEEDKVFETAMSNTQIRAMPRMYMEPTELVRPPYETGAFMAVDSDVTYLPKMKVPILTTTKMRNGAVAVFYPGVMEKIAELFGNSYYVVFTGMNIARVHHAESQSPRSILSTLKDFNKAYSDEGILSRKVFLYDKDKKTFKALEL